MRDYRLLLRNKNFVYLWVSQILSQLSINIMNFLLLSRLFSVTNSSIATSFLWVAYSIPAILIGPFASAYVDMTDRRRVLVYTNLFQFLVILIYAFIFNVRLFLLYGVALAYSFFNQFYVPAESASLPSLVNKKSLAFANSLFFLTQQFSIIAGFGFAGIINQLLGFRNSLLLCSSFLLIAFVSVSFLPVMRFNKEKAKSLDKLFFDFFVRIKEGYEFIKNNRMVLFPFLLLLFMQVGIAIVVVNTPLLAQEILRVHYDKVGVLVVVPAGIGALLGALIVPFIFKKYKIRKKTVVETSLIMISVSMLLFSFLFLWFNLLWMGIISFLLLILIGFSFVSIIVPTQTFLQEKVPGGLRGRIFGNFWFLVTVASIFPVIFSGALTEFLGVRFLILLISALTFSCALFLKKKGDDLIGG